MPTGVYQRRPGLRRNRKTKAYSPELIEQVRTFYWNQEMTQVETARACAISVRQVEHIMEQNGIPARVPRSFGGGPLAPSWKGDTASYSALHHRVYVARGLPKECSVCGTTDPTKYYDWANLSGNYADVNDYARMCRGCHVKHDRAAKVAV